MEGKEHLIALDRRQNGTREALRALRNMAPEHSCGGSGITAANKAPKKVWMLWNGGSTFVRRSTADAVEWLVKDQRDTSRMIEEARNELDAAVKHLAELEGADSHLGNLHKGFDLRPVNKP